MKKAILISGFCVCLLSVKGQDSLSLKSGKSMTGQIISFADSIVKIKIGPETFDYKLNEIKSLRYNGPVSAKNIQVPLKTETENKDSKRRNKELQTKPVND